MNVFLELLYLFPSTIFLKFLAINIPPAVTLPSYWIISNICKNGLPFDHCKELCINASLNRWYAALVWAFQKPAKDMFIGKANAPQTSKNQSHLQRLHVLLHLSSICQYRDTPCGGFPLRHGTATKPKTLEASGTETWYMIYHWNLCHILIAILERKFRKYQYTATKHHGVRRLKSI